MTQVGVHVLLAEVLAMKSQAMSTRLVLFMTQR